MTHDALRAYLASRADVFVLADKIMDESIDGNVLVDAIKSAKKPDPSALAVFFHADAGIGHLAKLAHKLHTFIETEDKVAALNRADAKKVDLEKRARLCAAIEKEKEARVSAATGTDPGAGTVPLVRSVVQGGRVWVRQLERVGGYGWRRTGRAVDGGGGVWVRGHFGGPTSPFFSQPRRSNSDYHYP